TVTVHDNQNPSISCVSSPQNKNTNTGVCTYTSVGTEFNPASFADNCTGSSVSYTLSGVTTGTGTSLAGVVFNKGTTTVTWKVTDASSNTATCSFNAVVSDIEVPVISCPANVTINCQASTATSNTGNATATDNCSPAPAISNSDASTQDADASHAAHY